MRPWGLAMAVAALGCGGSAKTTRVETAHPRAPGGASSMNEVSVVGQHASGSTYEYVAGWAPTDDGFEVEIIGHADNPSNADVATWRVQLVDDEGNHHDPRLVMPGVVERGGATGKVTPLAGARPGRMTGTNRRATYAPAQSGAGDIGGDVASGYTHTGSGPVTGDLAGKRKHAGAALYVFAGPRLASTELRAMTLVVTSESAEAKFAWTFRPIDAWRPGATPASPTTP